MKYFLSYLSFVLILMSCTDQTEEKLMVATIRNSNGLLTEQNEIYFRAIKSQVSSDTRERTQKLRLQTELIDSTIKNLVQQIRLAENGVDGRFLYEKKKRDHPRNCR